MAARVDVRAAPMARRSVMTPATDARGRVRAAGGLVERGGRVPLVHRPRYDDWSFPKGKARSRWESDRATARREVREETGLRCRLLERLPDAVYTDGKGRPKIVRYWRMAPKDGAQDGGFVPGDEVDEVRWLPPDEARDLLTYDHDRAVLEALGSRAGG
jgi:8-oxo-dGTP diphosphatase